MESKANKFICAILFIMLCLGCAPFYIQYFFCSDTLLDFIFDATPITVGWLGGLVIIFVLYRKNPLKL